MTTITINGWTGDFEAARALMDDDLCDRIHGLVETEQEFCDAYAEIHLTHYGVEFVVN